jgi:hypothetical protein
VKVRVGKMRYAAPQITIMHTLQFAGLILVTITFKITIQVNRSELTLAFYSFGFELQVK